MDNLYSNPIKHYDEKRFLNFLPTIQHTEGMIEFLKPPSSLMGWLSEYSERLKDLGKWDQVPERYITALAANFNFEILEIPYATEAERRHFLEWIIWLYRRRGTSVGAKKFIELLGFTPIWTEAHPSWVPLVTNFHRSYSMNRITSSVQMTDPFNNLHQWGSPNNLTAYWRIVSGELVVNGSGTTNPMDILSTTFNSTKYRTSVKYEVTSSLVTGDEWGIMLDYQDDDNYVALIIIIGSSNDSLAIKYRVGGGSPIYRYFSPFINALLASSEYRTGQHTMWIFTDHTTDTFTAGIDDLTIDVDFNPPVTFPGSAKKGLVINNWTANNNMVVEWDDMDIRELNYDQASRTYSSTLQSNKVQMGLDGAPEFALSKKNYLIGIMPRYIPWMVELEYALGNDRIRDIEDRCIDGIVNWANANMNKFSVANGKIEVSGSTGQYCYLNDPYFKGWESGKSYRVYYDHTVDEGVFIFMTLGATPQGVGTLQAGKGNYMDVTITEAESGLSLSANAASCIGTVDNISVIEI